MAIHVATTAASASQPICPSHQMPSPPTQLSAHETCLRASSAHLSWQQHGTGTTRATVLESIAAALDTARRQIVSTASEETALTIDELDPEFDRMTGTLRMFAAIVREGSWVRAAISGSPSLWEGDGGRARAPQVSHENRASSPAVPFLIGPNHDVRSMLIPLGPVAVFGSSNFPLAYGVCGGDTASAVAAGCPVIIKEHPAHPLTGRLLHTIASRAATAAGAPDGLLGYIRNTDASDFSAAESLIAHPAVRAVGFTGSTHAGLALERLARQRSIPIPVFAEMGSNNVVVVTAAAAAARADQIAEELAASILQRFGQQCTRPGTIIVELGESGTNFVNALAERINRSAGRDMLAPWVRDSYMRRLAEVQACRGVRLAARCGDKASPRGAHACLFCIDELEMVTQSVFETHQTLRDEIFGPAAIVVRFPIDKVTNLGLHASLAYSVYFEPDEISNANERTFDAANFHGLHSTGRIIFNGPPTGVRVAPGMVHGGPFPATNHPDTTAVGPRAIERWCRPICWQNAPQSLLPPELQDHNPLNIRRDEAP